MKRLARRLLGTALLGLLSLLAPLHAMSADDDTDPYLWLEDVQGERALAWVRERNAETLGELRARPDFEPTRQQLLSILNAKDRIPAVRRIGERLYNLWQDGTHKRGLWRRTTLAEYRQAAPMRWWCANSTWSTRPSSTAASRCPRRSPT